MDDKNFGPHKPAVFRAPTEAEAKRHGKTARILDISPGMQVYRRDSEKALRKAFKLSGRQWKKRKRALKAALEEAKALTQARVSGGELPNAPE